MNNYAKCAKCGWLHFNMSLEKCLQWEQEWVYHFNRMTEEQRGYYGLKESPPKIEDEYMSCFRCGNTYKDFIDAVESDAPNGSTIQPILYREEELVRC